MEKLTDNEASNTLNRVNSSNTLNTLNSPKIEKKMRNPTRHNSRDNILQKKVRRSLPENFFEKVLDLELKIKRDFSMESLGELVDLYTIAIEWYESVEDPKYKDYQNRLNILLSQPEILKSMNEIKKLGDKDYNSEEFALKLKKEHEKNQIKIKVNYISQMSSFSKNSDQVIKIIENYDKESVKIEKVENCLNQEINKQQDNFKIRLEEKRKKQSLINLPKVMNEPVETKHKKRGSLFLDTSYINKKSNKSSLNVISGFRGALNALNGLSVDGSSEGENSRINILSSRTKKTDRTKSDKSLVESDEDSKSSHHDFHSDIKEEKEEIENRNSDLKMQNIQSPSKYNKPTILIEDINLDNSFDNFEKMKIVDIEEMLSPINHEYQNGNNQDKFNISVVNANKSRDNSMMVSKFEENLIGPKHIQMFAEIRDTLDQFNDEFNFFFYEHVFQRFTEHIQKLMDEKYHKYTEVSKNYHSQIKEMEFLITGDSEDQHKENIKNIVDSLREEQQHELERIEDHYDKLISEAQASFKNFGFKNNAGIQLIEEKLKLDMYNLINIMLLPKK